MSEKNDILNELTSLLAQSCGYLRNDEYQMIHNQMIRKIASYLLIDHLKGLEGEIE